MIIVRPSNLDIIFILRIICTLHSALPFDLEKLDGVSLKLTVAVASWLHRQRLNACEGLGPPINEHLLWKLQLVLEIFQVVSQCKGCHCHPYAEDEEYALTENGYDTYIDLQSPIILTLLLLLLLLLKLFILLDLATLK